MATTLHASEFTEDDERFMRAALEEAEGALNRWEVPVGCVLVRDGTVVASGSNRTNEKRNGTRHAEFEAIDALLQTHGGDPVAAGFDRCVLYVTVEPCIMCAGALSLLGFEKVYYGCGNDKFGGNGSILSIHEDGCAPCAMEPQSQMDPSTVESSSHDASVANDSAKARRTYPSFGGLFAEDAIRLLQDFYIRGNPKAPKPHRALAPESHQRRQFEGDA